jgi:hypothetical protein
MGGTGAISGTGNYVVQAGTHNYMVTDAMAVQVQLH